MNRPARKYRPPAWHFVCGLLVLLALYVPVSAQGWRPVPGFSALRNGAGRATELPGPAGSHYDVVALRVEFQPDTSRFTTGDGTFEGDPYGGLIPKVDPLPHDTRYFEAHLNFLKGYVANVSNGHTALTTHVVNETVRLSKPMSAYAPTGPEANSDEQLRKLAAMVEEAWALASRQSSFDSRFIDPQRTAFVIFHAGIGRDVELTGTTLDRTPEDLPSLYFSPETLRRLLGGRAITFKGIPVDHSIVLPRSETRKGMNFLTNEPFLAEFSINGLIAASFFNYLGIPDLYNTETGESAIGPFGLMDPLGIFAMNGLFPPEPSGFTKYLLGWEAPVELGGAGPITTSLAAAVMPAVPEPRLAIARISDREYFLIENRYRGDIDRNSFRMDVSLPDGTRQAFFFSYSDSTFNPAAITGFPGGVVESVDNFDFALPGGTDENGTPLLGGILIWHIDENRLEQALATNRVNADPQHRAVDLEEADGPQDIGFPSGGDFGPEFHLGNPFDFWYRDNPVSVRTASGRTIRLFQNRFGADTTPNSHSNAGGPSFIELYDFSAPGPVMTFSYRRTGSAGADLVRTDTLEGFFGPGSGLIDVSTSAAPGRLLAYGNRERNGAGCLWLVSQSSVPQRSVCGFDLLARPVVIGQTSAQTLVLVYRRTGETTARLLRVPLVELESGLFDLRAESFDIGALPEGSSVLSPVGGGQDGREWANVIITRQGVPESRHLIVRPGTDPVEARSLPGEVVTAAYAGEGQLLVVTRSGASLLGGVEKWSFTLGGSEVIGQAIAGRDAGGFIAMVPRPSEGRIIILRPQGQVHSISVGSFSAISDPGLHSSFDRLIDPLLHFIDPDGYLDILMVSGKELKAWTQQGALVAGFPIPLDAEATSSLRLASAGEKGPVVLLADRNGYLHAYPAGGRGREQEGFPLATGARIGSEYIAAGERITALSGNGTLRSWKVAGDLTALWPVRGGDASNRNYVDAGMVENPLPAGGDLLDATETYNWPNPIRNGETRIRYRTARDCRIEITIVDAAGSLIERLAVEGVRAGIPGEAAWSANVASGLYFARVTARTPDGETSTRLVKMAVIR